VHDWQLWQDGEIDGELRQGGQIPDGSSSIAEAVEAGGVVFTEYYLYILPYTYEYLGS
jgi:hypothetical protein